MRSVVDAITTAVVTANPLRAKIISTTVRLAVVLDNLTGAKNIECGRKPDHVKDSQNSKWYSGKNNYSLNFAYDFGSDLHKILASVLDCCMVYSLHSSFYNSSPCEL